MRQYKEFKKLWLGKTVRDGQCVSLFREYTEGFHDTPMLERLGAYGGALGLYTRYDTDVGSVSRKIFERIPYIKGSTERPREGDVVIFGATGSNKYGHVGIMDSEYDYNILIMDQDGLLTINKTGKTPIAKLTEWRMDNVLGWLRFRDESIYN